MECPHQNVVEEVSEQTNLDYSVGTTCPSGILLEQCKLISWTHTDFEWIKAANSIDINCLPLLILLLMIKLNIQEHDFNDFSVCFLLSS